MWSNQIGKWNEGQQGHRVRREDVGGSVTGPCRICGTFYLGLGLRVFKIYIANPRAITENELKILHWDLNVSLKFCQIFKEEIILILNIQTDGGPLHIHGLKASILLRNQLGKIDLQIHFSPNPHSSKIFYRYWQTGVEGTRPRECSLGTQTSLFPE